jgi:ABC-2 type transport system ATP-binding protein
VSSSEAIVLSGVSKSFRINRDPVMSVKERVVRLRSRHFTEFTALHPLSVNIAVGETVGILGHNGSGKSTLLKCIAGILRPSTGTVAVRGRLASLLELGAGFHPELTGRENVYINAAFLGIPRREIHLRLDDIVEFAELGQFIDEPVKHYSSGMYVRLGFAVAVNLEPDVLLVDEVLAVGDESFARKCMNRVKHLQSEGKSIVVVTHSADTVRQVCNRALVLDHGHLVAEGAPDEAIRVFRERLQGTLVDDHHAAGAIRFDDVVLSVDGHDVDVSCRVVAADPVTGQPVENTLGVLALGIELTDSGGRFIHRVNTVHLDRDIVPRHEPYHFRFRIDRLLPGDYQATIRLAQRQSGRLLDWRDLALSAPGRRVGEGFVDLGVSIGD